MHPIRPGARAALIALLLASVSSPAGLAQEAAGPVSINTYGVPGLIDMPSAQPQPDGELTSSVTALSNESGRTQLAFQLHPRVQGVFRYATLPDFLEVDGTFERTYDRSFDVRFQVFREQGWVPDVAVGLQDFGGTSLFSGEYVVATKTFLDGRLAATGGIGWGRFATNGEFENPLGALGNRFDERPAFDVNSSGGDFSADAWFRGPAALFGGVSWRATDRLTLKAEYSSDGYDQEERQGIFDRATPLNFGLDYAIRPGMRLGAYAIGGSELALTFSLAANPKRPPAGGSRLDEAPRPVTLRPSRQAQPQAWTTAWVGDARIEAPVVAALDEILDEAGLELIAYRLEADRAEITFRNPRYQAQSQAIGRAARAMTAALPPSVETFVLIPENERSLPGAAVILRRSDIEALENRPNGAAEALAVAGIVDAETLPGRPTYAEAAYPRFRWELGPFFDYGLFDPDNPVRADLGIELAAEWEPFRGALLSGAVRQKLIGNRDEYERDNNSVLPRVRTDGPEFARTDGPYVPYLTAEYFFRPAQALYARGSVGLLEREFGGASAELLWKPVSSRLAVGLEANVVRQREFEGGLGFRDLDAETAFVSAYYDHGARFHSQLDVGQYLAGDRGATYTLTREFSNGWQVGAFATKTDVSAEEFGEGSFDKGFFVTIPNAWLLGRESRSSSGITIRPVQRDGGARLNLRNRLYPLVRDQSPPVLTEQWGRVWR